MAKEKYEKLTVTLENASAHVTRIWHILFVIGNMDFHLLAGGCSHSTNRTLMILDLVMPHHMDLKFILGNETLWTNFAAERIHFDGSMCVDVFLNSNKLEAQSELIKVCEIVSDAKPI